MFRLVLVFMQFYFSILRNISLWHFTYSGIFHFVVFHTQEYFTLKFYTLRNVSLWIFTCRNISLWGFYILRSISLWRFYILRNISLSSFTYSGIFHFCVLHTQEYFTLGFDMCILRNISLWCFTYSEIFYFGVLHNQEYFTLARENQGKPSRLLADLSPYMYEN